MHKVRLNKMLKTEVELAVSYMTRYAIPPSFAILNQYRYDTIAVVVSHSNMYSYGPIVIII